MAPLSERLNTAVPTELLAPAEGHLWDRYLAEEARGLRRPALATLDTLLDKLAVYLPQRRNAFARALCASVADQDAGVLLRYPLLDRLLWPFLLAEYQAGDPAAPRWLAQLTQWVRPAEPTHPLRTDPAFTTEALLREALRRAPNDAVALAMLVRHLAQWFNYTIHEVPSGVLYGINGATADDCRQMRVEVDEFRELAEAAGVLPDYEECICEWAFHFERYPEYLGQDCYQSYAEYLAQWAE